MKESINFKYQYNAYFVREHTVSAHTNENSALTDVKFFLPRYPVRYPQLAATAEHSVINPDQRHLTTATAQGIVYLKTMAI